MPSFLITKKMDPDLARRVQNSLWDDAAARKRSKKRRSLRRWGRPLALTLLLGLGAFLLSTYQESRREFHAAQNKLTARFEKARASYGRRERQRLRRIERLLTEASQKRRPEIISPSVKGTQALDELFNDGALYVRGTAPDLATPRGIKETAAESTVDALALCLATPPPSRQETDLLRSLGKMGETAAADHFHRLARLYEQRDFFESDFGEELAQAKHMNQIRRLNQRFSARDFQSEKEAQSADLLLYAIDEPLLAGQSSDFDGEGKHHIRLGLVRISKGHEPTETSSSKTRQPQNEVGRPRPSSPPSQQRQKQGVDIETFEVLLRLRREVSPEWISDKSRLQFSRPLDSCRLAYDIRQELAGKPTAHPEESAEPKEAR